MSVTRLAAGRSIPCISFLRVLPWSAVIRLFETSARQSDVRLLSRAIALASLLLALIRAQYSLLFLDIVNTCSFYQRKSSGQVFTRLIIYPFQSHKSRSWRSFSRLEVSAGSRNQAIAPNSKINCCNLITSAPPTLLYSRSRIVPTSIAGSNHLTNARKPP